jgi:hypothetical protein
MPRKKSKKFAIIAGLIGVFLLLNKKAKGMALNKLSLDKFTGDTRLKLLKIQDALIQAGIDTDLQLKLALAQVLFETGKFTRKSKVAELNNNYSGIKWLNKPYQKASKGSLVPPGERLANANSPLNYYAKFISDEAWAADFIRILSLGRYKPLQADSLQQFVKRLANNRYFDASAPSKIDNYTKGVKFYFDLLG